MGIVSTASGVGNKNKPIVIEARDHDRGDDMLRSRQQLDSSTATEAADDEAEAEAVDAVYRSLLTSICVEVACGVHRSAKTGTMPYSELMVPSASSRPGGGRRKRTCSGEMVVAGDEEKDPSSPSTTEDGDAGANSRDETSTGVAGRNSRGAALAANNGDKGSVGGAGAGGGDANNPPHGSSGNTNNSNSGGNSNSNSNCDVYGRVPPKEPKLPARCMLCGRTVSALRFAPHLDKCMGIGNRNAAGGGNGVGSGGASGVGGGYGAGYGSSTRSGGAKLS